MLNIQPELYSTVSLTSAQQCVSTLAMLHRRPDIARHVRKLVIRPDRNSHTAHEDRKAASASVLDLAASKRLDALQAFEWDGEEMAPIDDMWFALRIGCPLLRYIGTTIGFHLIARHSQLCDFSNLHGFSIKLKSGFYHDYADFFLQEDHPTLQSFWDMLVEKCPDLQQLEVSGSASSSSEFTVVRSLLQGRWPRLRKLSLGDVSVDPQVPMPGTVHPFVTFLEEHPSLQVIHLSRHNVHPSYLAALTPASLPDVTEFHGSLEQLHALPHLHPSLESVVFTDPMRTREFTPPAVSAVLMNMPKIRHLGISFTLTTMYDSNSLLKTIVYACPHLQSLSLSCTQKPSFQLETFSRTIRSLTKLRTFHLAMVRYPGDEPLISGAARIARNNPRLESFSLAFIPTITSHTLVPSMHPLTSQLATYTVTPDVHGLPYRLSGVERKLVLWPWGLGCTRSKRRFTRNLRTGSNMDSGGMFKIMFEQSTAGEETRMMAFSCGLVLLAAWGFASGAFK
jgi:hypothetical protein